MDVLTLMIPTQEKPLCTFARCFVDEKHSSHVYSRLYSVDVQGLFVKTITLVI